MSSVYRLLASQDEDRPELDLSEFESDWRQILSGDEVVRLATTAPATDVEFFSLAGTLGAASDRLASDLLRIGCLDAHPMMVEGRGFQIVLAGTPLQDALDREQSDCAFFRSTPTKIKQIRSFAFHATAIPNTPLVFTIPESPALLLANEPAVE